MAPAAERSRAAVPVASGKSPTWARFRTMLWSRTGETSAIDQLLARARTGQGGGLLLRGEPGIGKSALLAYARTRAGGLCVLEAAGAAAESDLAYAALHQLIAPLLAGVDGLPQPQAAALRIALGLRAVPTLI